VPGGAWAKAGAPSAIDTAVSKLEITNLDMDVLPEFLLFVGKRLMRPSGRRGRSIGRRPSLRNRNVHPELFTAASRQRDHNGARAGLDVMPRCDAGRMRNRAPALIFASSKH
jgi:hypothetical protein